MKVRVDHCQLVLQRDRPVILVKIIRFGGSRQLPRLRFERREDVSRERGTRFASSHRSTSWARFDLI
ncbi:hypothetical protein [Microbacterium imperiale]|uniref:Uncharacterized protein n=1 Tax=Microbacterium imperiale TaxID=33884 RepID=A0A9W6HGW3_9MICO|nr:hypothetical protein [Microbacterium imperiale]MBP2422017.1 hypothetical protein [Microbacterium imperiale]MDS0200175.1 hypothetical protein [Microbacterium imperiale]BFE39325.1 hypothetical protein GCM10017544_02810 [Microbacterium imperiale]GLJ79809.1 hypothetical protein GCM10017586_14910 [Microbacterium imperiale]